MHERMRDMVDEEKEGMLKELLKQMYDRMTADKSPESSSEEMSEGVMGDGIKEAEGEELAHEALESDDEGSGDDVRDEISSFMKNKHKPAPSKSASFMIKVGGSKPLMKSKGRK